MLSWSQEFSKEEYFVRIKWLIGSRVLLIDLSGRDAYLYSSSEYNDLSFHNRYLYYYTLSAIYIADRHLLVPASQDQESRPLRLSSDRQSISCSSPSSCYLTGGIDSGFSLLYHLTIISASIILYRRGGYLAASLRQHSLRRHAGHAVL